MPSLPNRKVLLLSLTAAVLVAGIGVAAFKPFAKPPETIKVERRTLEEIVEVSGMVEAAKSVVLKAETSGVVQEKLVPENAQAKKGQLLLRLDPDQAKAQLDQAEANAKAAVLQARTALANARKTLDETTARQRVSLQNARNQLKKADSNVGFLSGELARNESLLAEGGVASQAIESQRQQLQQAKLDARIARDNLERISTQTELVQAKNAYAQAATALDNATEQGRTAVAVAREAHERTRLTAPFAGTLTDWKVEEGDMVAPGTPLATLKTLDDLKLNLPVDELDVPKMRQGQEVSITFDAYAETPFKGRIVQIGRSSTAGAEKVQVFPVKVVFDDPEHRIKPGMSGDARILVAEHKDAISIPIGAVQRDKDKFTVNVLRDKKPVPVEIKPGISTLDYLEVKEGLQVGDPLVMPGGLKGNGK